MKISTLILACALVFSSSANALQTPTKSELDKRITKAVYHEDDVFPVYAVPGRATLISFQKGETALSWASGYSTAWEFDATNNHFLLKPKAENASTNLVVLTNKRTYHFDLRLGWKRALATYELRFSYPEDERKAAIAKIEAEKRKALLAQSPVSKDELMSEKFVNRNYTMNFGGARDSRKLAPEAAFDDGRFTYLKFHLKSDFPAVYHVTGGEETLVNAHVEGQWLVVHGIYPELRLRNGLQVVGVYNEDFHTRSVTDTPTNVTVDGLKREIK